MIATIYISLALLYTIACVMDGHDVKPLWKRWLSDKLIAAAKYFVPFTICDKSKCDVFMKNMIAYNKSIKHTTFQSKIIESKCVVPCYDVERAMYDERMAKEHNLLLPKGRTVNGIIEYAREQCMKGVLRSVQPFVQIDVRRDEYRGDIYVNGSVVVGEKKI